MPLSLFYQRGKILIIYTLTFSNQLENTFLSLSIIIQVGYGTIRYLTELYEHKDNYKTMFDNKNRDQYLEK